MNLDSDHDGWDALRELGAVPVVNDGETTLSTTDGRYANQYDHIWATPGVLDISASGKIRFPEMLGIDHETARATVSDHAPIWVAIGDAELVLSHATQTPALMPTQAANDERYDCIDLNSSDVSTLEQLPHIDPARAEHVMDGRPWKSIAKLVNIR